VVFLLLITFGSLRSAWICFGNGASRLQCRTKTVGSRARVGAVRRDLDRESEVLSAGGACVSLRCIRTHKAWLCSSPLKEVESHSDISLCAHGSHANATEMSSLCSLPNGPDCGSHEMMSLSGRSPASFRLDQAIE
jgi:hypothetical protein